MCEMTSMGEMSAARTTMPAGGEEEGTEGDLRSALTTSLTPRLRDLDAAAVGGETREDMKASIALQRRDMGRKKKRSAYMAQRFRGHESKIKVTVSMGLWPFPAEETEKHECLTWMGRDPAGRASSAGLAMLFAESTGLLSCPVLFCSSRWSRGHIVAMARCTEGGMKMHASPSHPRDCKMAASRRYLSRKAVGHVFTQSRSRGDRSWQGCWSAGIWKRRGVSFYSRSKP